MNDLARTRLTVIVFGIGGNKLRKNCLLFRCIQFIEIYFFCLLRNNDKFFSAMHADLAFIAHLLAAMRATDQSHG